MYLNLRTTHIMYGAVCGSVLLCVLVMPGVMGEAFAVGGDVPGSAADVRVIEHRLMDLRSKQPIQARRIALLREQLAVLDAAIDADPRAVGEYRVVRDDLLALLLDTRRAEEEIAEALRELWSAQGFAERASRRAHGNERVTFDWPVEPARGISAHFDDTAYRARFGFAHNAIDIPVDQGSVVRSVADGVVEKVSDQGYGFNSIVIRHRGGYASLYGHVTEFLVHEGDDVSMGDIIARSGGMPGTKGAGLITTGPHLHLELLHDGTHIDPLPLLPTTDAAE